MTTREINMYLVRGSNKPLWREQRTLTILRNDRNREAIRLRREGDGPYHRPEFELDCYDSIFFTARVDLKAGR